MAEDDRQPQGHQLHHELGVGEVRFQLAQLPALAQHQQAQAMQFGQRETHGICVVEDVGPVLVVVAVGDMRADFMQLRGPAKFAGVACIVGIGEHRFQLPEQLDRHPSDPAAMDAIGVELGRQPLHRYGPHVERLAVAPGQVAQQPVAQSAGGGLHLVDLQQIEDRAQDADATADHCPPVFLHARQAQPVCALCLHQFGQQPVQPGTADRAGRPPRVGQDVAHRPDRASRAVGHVPAVAPVGLQGFVEHGLGGDLGHLERLRAELPIREVAGRPGNAAHAVRLHLPRLESLAQDQLGGAPADVRHQTPFIGLRQHLRHSEIDQSGFFATGNDVDRKSQDAVGPGQELVAVARLAQGLRGDGPDLRLLESGEPFTEPGQAVPATLHGLCAQVAFGIQTAPLTDGFLQVFGAFELAMVESYDLQPKTVRAEIDGGKARSVVHGFGEAVFASIALAPGHLQISGGERVQNTSGTTISCGTGWRT